MAVTRRHERAGDDVMGQHLMIVLAPLLDVDGEDLLQPKGELNKVISFQEAVHLPIGPCGPHLAKVHPIVRLGEDVLSDDQPWSRQGGRSLIAEDGPTIPTPNEVA